MKILFVCSSNICRSPYAELTFKKLVASDTALDEIVGSVTSSAVFNRSKQIHPLTAKILSEEGTIQAEIDSFRPDYIRDNRAKFDEADIIIGMGKLQKIMLPKRYRYKYTSLSEAATGKYSSIPDPFLFVTEDSYRKTMATILSYLKQYSQKLVKNEK